MNFIKSLSGNTIKYFKGLLAIAIVWLIPALCIFIFDSCKKSEYNKSQSGEAARKFTKVLEETRTSLGFITLGSNNSFQSLTTESTGNYYLDFPDETSPESISDFQSNVTIQKLQNVLTNHGVSIDDSINTNAEVIIQVSGDSIRNVLQPLVVEAKNYLMAKGATNQQIMDMLQEEGSEEIDLIPFAKALTAIEHDQYTVRNISSPFINEANALPKFVECGLAALGGDALYSLSLSGASSWTWGAMKTAFKSIAKRFLGPIGVAVAVVSFGICML